MSCLYPNKIGQKLTENQRVKHANFSCLAGSQTFWPNFYRPIRHVSVFFSRSIRLVNFLFRIRIEDHLLTFDCCVWWSGWYSICFIFWTCSNSQAFDFWIFEIWYPDFYGIFLFRNLNSFSYLSSYYSIFNFLIYFCVSSTFLNLDDFIVVDISILTILFYIGSLFLMKCV